MTLDGVIQDPGGTGEYDRGGWTFDYNRGDEGDKFKLGRAEGPPTHSCKDGSPRGHDAAWPTMKDDAGFRGQDEQHAQVRRLHHAQGPEWENSTVISDNVPEEVASEGQYEGDI